MGIIIFNYHGGIRRNLFVVIGYKVIDSYDKALIKNIKKKKNSH